MFGGGKKTIIGLDIGSWAVKAVAIQQVKDRLTLQGYAQMRLSEGEQYKASQQVIEHLGVRSKNVVVAVSGRSVIVRQVETPRLADAELRSHMTYEADKYIPFSADEVVMDCFPLPDRQGADPGKQDVLLVAARKGFVEDFVQGLHGVGIQPSVVDVDIFALTNAFWTLGPGALGDPETIALVDIGAAKSWVAIVRGDRLLFQREIYLAGNEITDAVVRTFNESAADVEEIKLNPGDVLETLLDAATPAFEDLANEVRLSFDYVEGQFDLQVDRVVLTGGSSLMPGLPEILGNILGRPVTVFDPLSGVDLITSRYDLHSLEANAPALTIALGLACHLGATEKTRGLGGAQVASWQSRGGKRVGRTATQSDARRPASADADAETVVETRPTSPPPPPPPLEIPLAAAAASGPGLAMVLPPPAASGPAVSIPSAAMAIPAWEDPPAGVLNPPSETNVAGITDTFGQEPSQMLVVLDDDDEDGMQSDAFSNPDVHSLPPEGDGRSGRSSGGGLPPLPR